MPGVIIWKVGQDVYAVRVGDNKILDRDHTQLCPRAPDPSGHPVTFEFKAGNVDSDDEGEDDDFTAEKILTDKPDRGRLGRGYIKSVGRDLPHPEIRGSLRAVLFRGIPRSGWII